mgnify:CR=1 FL=1
MKNVVIVDGVRTGFGKLGGSLRQFGMSDLAAKAIDGLLDKTQLLELLPQVCSLDAPAGEDGTLQLLLEGLQAPQPYEELVRRELEQTIQTLLSTLNDRQQKIP